MRHPLRLAFALAALALLSFALPERSWVVPAGATASFRIRGPLGLDAKGTIRFDSAAIRFDPAHPEAGSLYVSLRAASVNTGIRLRDRHLREAGFLDAARYPEIRFVSTGVRPAGSGYRVEGALTIRDVTRPVSIPFTFETGPAGGTFRGAFAIDRLDFGVGAHYGRSIGRSVRIRLEVPVLAAQ